MWLRVMIDERGVCRSSVVDANPLLGKHLHVAIPSALSSTHRLYQFWLDLVKLVTIICIMARESRYAKRNKQTKDDGEAESTVWHVSSVEGM